MTSNPVANNDASREEIRDKAAESLSSRLSDFRAWLKQDAGCVVHPSVCIVNSEATDGTKNAPVLTLGVTTDLSSDKESDRLGSVEGCGGESMYVKTMGCQVRAVREMKKGEVWMTLPRASMVTPDLVACSDAGRAVLGCIKQIPVSKAEIAPERTFWDAFTNTREKENSFKPKTTPGPHLLVKILQERKRVETAVSSRLSNGNDAFEGGYTLVENGTISTRAPLLAFLIHQRFHSDAKPSVVSKGKKSKDQFKLVASENPPNSLRSAIQIVQPPGSPQTFGPYARTLPSSVLIPICWTREELALLSGCIPGRAILEDVLAQTMQLAAEFIALLDAGILERFPETFQPGMLTWDRWVWAASIVASRNLPAAVYFTKDDLNASSFKPVDDKEFQSPPEIWDELGVMVPLLDMLNHEIEAHQVRWQPEVTEGIATEEEGVHPPRGMLEKRVKKGSEIFCAYGDLNNHDLVLQYGFAQINNIRDEARIGWGLSEAVGRVDIPADFEPPMEGGDNVYESTNEEATAKWWTEERLKLLQREANLGEPLIGRLKQGQKLTALAYNDGVIHPILLAAAVVASMPHSSVAKAEEKIVLNQRHQKSFRNLLASIFSKKLEKLLHNLDGGLKAHFGNLSLWTNASKGGLRYKPEADGGDEKKLVGWQTFFEEHAYRATMEVERNYYAMAPDSCVLALYDGHLRSLQLSIDRVTNEEGFQADVANQLQDLGYILSSEPGDEADPETDSDEKPESTSVGAKDDTSMSAGGGEKKSPSRRRRNRKKGKEGNASINSTATGPDKPPALKLHVGNLAYSTTPSDLYDFFSSVYGKDNILECHIPVERESGRSRGFGFVTMPESVAVKALTSGKKHEIAGRLLKVARSNSAGTTDSGRAQPASQTVVPKDRCAVCGYRPKYCVCSIPALPSAPPCPPVRDAPYRDIPPPPRDPAWRRDDLPPPDRHGSGGSRYRDDRHPDDRLDRPPRDYDRAGYVGGYDPYGREYDRDYDLGGERRRDRPSSSRSYHSDYDRGEDRHRDRIRHHRSYSRSPSPRADDELRGSRSDRDYSRRKLSRSRSPRSASLSPERSRKKRSKRREA